ncbi:MAG: DUF4397 domain-containing protein [Sphingobacteriaceae bacterium]|nr:MAG: DUF4397 domain-containing protein [Sphingobacteriaceae bacterium]
MKKQQFLLGLMWVVISITNFSCGTTNGVNPAAYSRIQIINAIAGSSSLDCTLNSTRINTTTLAFPNTTGYISATPGTKYVEIRPTSTPTAPFIDTATVVLKQDSSYSLFFAGQSGSPKSIFIQDNLSAPTLGRAKLRFVNASSTSGNLNITINAVTGYTNIAYRGVGKFVEVPAGTYEFKAFASGATSTNTLGTLSNQVLADGKVYTLYAQGIVGNSSTTSAFGLSLIANLLPAVK